jgi:2-furoyl-CoA dehydrogenase large subunit
VTIRRVAGLAHWDPGSLPPGVEPLLTVTASFSSELARSPDRDDTVDSSICYGGVADLCLVEWAASSSVSPTSSPTSART